MLSQKNTFAAKTANITQRYFLKGVCSTKNAVRKLPRPLRKTA